MNIRTLLLCCCFTFGTGDILNRIEKKRFIVIALISPDPESEGWDQYNKCQELILACRHAEAQLKKELIKFEYYTCPLKDSDRICNKLSITKIGCDLRIFRNGKEGIPYNGPPDGSKFVNFVKSQLRPSKSINIVSLKNLEAIFNNNTGLFVGAFEKETKLKIVYKDLVDEVYGKIPAKFSDTSEKSVLEELGIKNGIAYLPPNYKRKNLKPVLYNGSESKDEIKNFVTTSLEKYIPIGSVIIHNTSENKSLRCNCTALLILTMIITYVWIF